MKLISPEFFSELSSLELYSRRIVDGFLSGFHQSSFRGYNVEFADHKSYQPGDALNAIDWKLLARTDRMYVRRYHEETSLRCLILIDSSRSMRFGRITKWNYSAFLASSLSFLMLRQKDSVGIWNFNEGLRKFLPPRSRRSHFQAVCSFLKEQKPDSGTLLAESINGLARNLKKRSLVILISDLLGDEEGLYSALRHLNYKKHEVIVFHVMSEEEVSFPYTGYISMVDSETGEKMELESGWLKKSYLTGLQEYRCKMKQFFLNSGIDYVFTDTSVPVEKVLGQYLRKRFFGRVNADF